MADIPTVTPIAARPTRFLFDACDLALAAWAASAGMAPEDRSDEYERRWIAEYERIARDADSVIELINAIGDEELEKLITESNAMQRDVSAFLDRARRFGGVTALIVEHLRRLHDRPVEPVLFDTSAACLIALAEVAAGAAVVAKVPFVAGFAIAHGVAMAADQC